jgi:hypothetical protein
MAALNALVAPGILVVPASAAAENPEIAGIWQPDGSRGRRFPADPPYTDRARQLIAQWRENRDPLEDDPGRWCQSPGMPSVALGGGGYPVEIVLASGQVLMLMEAHQQVRRIFLDATAHPARPLPQRNGHSIGRWDGDTLVVDTTAIRAITFGAIPHSAEAHVVERIRTIDGGAALVNELTITDPVFYAEPVIVEQYFTAAPPGSQMLEYECTEGMWIDHVESRGLSSGLDADSR